MPPLLIHSSSLLSLNSEESEILKNEREPHLANGKTWASHWFFSTHKISIPENHPAQVGSMSCHVMSVNSKTILTLRSHCCCLVAESCLIFCDPLDCNLPGSSDHGISLMYLNTWESISKINTIEFYICHWASDVLILHPRSGDLGISEGFLQTTASLAATYPQQEPAR